MRNFLSPKVQGFLRKVNPRRVSRPPKARAKAVVERGTRSIFLGLPEVTNVKSCLGHRIAPGLWIVREIALAYRPVPETDTGGLVENTQALERTMLKELGKLLA